MKKFYSLFLVLGFYQSLCADSYINHLDAVIDKNVAILEKSLLYKVNPIVCKLRKAIKNKIALSELHNLLKNPKTIAFFSCNEMQLNLHVSMENKAEVIKKTLQDLQFALGMQLYNYYLECAKHKMLHKAVCNHDALQYWEDENFYESQSFYQKNIFRFISSSSYKQKIDDNIKQLQCISKQTDSFLGLVLHNQQILHSAATHQELEAKFKEAIYLQDDYVQASEQSSDISTMNLVIENCIDQLSALSSHISAEHAQCQLPSHVVRHWKAYGFTTVAACAAAFIYLRYGADIAQGSQYFWHEHIQGAIERNRKTLSGVLEGPKLHIERLDTTENEKTAWLMIQEELKRPKPRGSKDDTIIGAWYTDANVATNGAVEEACQEIGDIVPVWMPGWIGRLFTSFKTQTNRIIQQGSEKFQAIKSTESSETQNEAQESYSDSEFQEQEQQALDRIRIVLANPERNPFRVIPSYSLKVELETMKAKKVFNDSQAGVEKVANEFLKDIYMIVGVGNLIPVIALVSGSLFASKSLYNSVAYQPIRTIVRKLEVFLNEIYYEPVTFDKEGHIYFLTEQLKLHVNVLTVPEQKLIVADIAALQAPSLDYVQKTNIVQRMYRTYPCLIPARM